MAYGLKASSCHPLKPAKCRSVFNQKTDNKIEKKGHAALQEPP